MVYESLGIRRVINAEARLTRLGGSLMPEPVLEAMRAAAKSHIDMFALQEKVGRRLAELTRNEAAYVCTGAAAGLVLSGAACLTRGDLALQARLPADRPPRHEIILHRAQRIPYDPALTLAGARLVEIGNALQTFPWELEAAINDKTAAVFYVAGPHLARGALTLVETVRIAHEHGLPVIVDAAAQLPPAENLWRLTSEIGADLAIFSGGKDLRGPQASGLIVGRADLIEACRTIGAPHQRLGRPMKVGKEEMVGLLVAIELYVVQNHAARIAGYETVVANWLKAIDGFPGVSAQRAFPNEAGQPVPRLLVEFDPERTTLTGERLRRLLWEGDPAIAVALAEPNGIYLTPDTLEPGEEELVASRLRQLLASAALAPTHS